MQKWKILIVKQENLAIVMLELLNIKFSAIF